MPCSFYITEVMLVDGFDHIDRLDGSKRSFLLAATGLLLYSSISTTALRLQTILANKTI